jgi:hypothetical protein
MVARLRDAPKAHRPSPRGARRYLAPRHPRGRGAHGPERTTPARSVLPTSAVISGGSVSSPMVAVSRSRGLRRARPACRMAARARRECAAARLRNPLRLSRGIRPVDRDAGATREVVDGFVAHAAVSRNATVDRATRLPFRARGAPPPRFQTEHEPHEPAADRAATGSPPRLAAMVRIAPSPMRQLASTAAASPTPRPPLRRRPAALARSRHDAARRSRR